MPASSDSGTGAGGKRRRARSGTGTGAGAGPSSQPRIGRRVIEVCRRHRCEDHDYEGGGAGGAAASAAAAAWTDAALAALYSGRPTAFASGAYVRAAVGRVGDRCSRKLEKIEGVLERLEEDHSAALDRAASPGGGDDGSGSDGDGSGDGSGSGAMAKLAADGEDLCTMYRSFLEGTFCPHSLSMLDWGRGGRKSELILCCWACPAPQCFPFLVFGPPPRVLPLPPRSHPLLPPHRHPHRRPSPPILSRRGRSVLGRVHLLLRHFPSAPVVSQMLRPRGGRDGDDAAPALAADVAGTVSLLLHSVPERSLRLAAVRDLVALLYDLAAVLGPSSLGWGGVGGNPNPGGVRVSLFHEMLDARAALGAGGARGGGGRGGGGEKFEVGIGSDLALLSFQYGTLSSMAGLLHLHRLLWRRSTGIDAPEVELEPVEDDGSGPLEPMGTYLASAGLEDSDVKRALLESIRALLQSPTADAPHRDGADVAASARGQRAVIGLHVKAKALELLNMVMAESPAHLRTLTYRALLSHLRSYSPSAISAFESYASDVKYLSDRYLSAMRRTLLESLTALSLPPSSAIDTEASSPNRLHVGILLDCATHIPSLVHQSPSEEEKRVCKLILRLIHALLHVSSRSAESLRSERILAHGHCVAHDVYPGLLNLVCDAAFSTIAVPIVAALLGSVDAGDWSIDLLRDACAICFDDQSKLLGDPKDAAEEDESHGLKRRKTSQSQHIRTGGTGDRTKERRRRQSPKEQLHIELSPKRKIKSETNASSPVPRKAMLSGYRSGPELINAGDSSPLTCIATMIGEALAESEIIFQGLNEAGKETGSENSVDASVLSSMTSRSVSVIGGSLKLIIRLLSAKGMDRDFPVVLVITSLNRAILLLANAVRYGAKGDGNRTIGPNRLKRALNVLVGVGFEIAFFSSSLKTAEEKKDDVEVSMESTAEAISSCARDAWKDGSSLLEQLRGKESGPSVEAGDALDNSHSPQVEEKVRGAECVGAIMALCASAAMTPADIPSTQYLCELLEDKSGNNGFARDLIRLLLEGELPLPSR